MDSPEEIKPVRPIPQPVHQFIPRPVSSPVPTAQGYDYPFEQRVPYQGNTHNTQIELPIYEERYQYRPVTQKLYPDEPKYVTVYPVIDELQKHSRQYIPHDKVEIYPQGEQKEEEVPDHIQTLNPVGSTVRPYDGRTTLVYNGYENILVSTVAPEYQNQVYVTQPTRHTTLPTHRYYRKR